MVKVFFLKNFYRSFLSQIGSSLSHALFSLGVSISLCRSSFFLCLGGRSTSSFFSTNVAHQLISRCLSLSIIFVFISRVTTIVCACDHRFSLKLKSLSFLVVAHPPISDFYTIFLSFSNSTNLSKLK